MTATFLSALVWCCVVTGVRLEISFHSLVEGLVWVSLSTARVPQVACACSLRYLFQEIYDLIHFILQHYSEHSQPLQRCKCGFSLI